MRPNFIAKHKRQAAGESGGSNEDKMASLNGKGRTLVGPNIDREIDEKTRLPFDLPVAKNIFIIKLILQLR